MAGAGRWYRLFCPLAAIKNVSFYILQPHSSKLPDVYLILGYNACFFYCLRCDFYIHPFLILTLAFLHLLSNSKISTYISVSSFDLNLPLHIS